MTDAIPNWRVHLSFPIGRVREPVLYHLIQDYHLVPNVRTANIDVHTGGILVLDIAGAEAELTAALEWMRSLGVRVVQEEIGAE